MRGPTIPDGLETVPIPDDHFSAYKGEDGVVRFISHPGIRRDARRLLAALGEVERDLQGTREGQWMLALRSSLSVVVQHDGRGTNTMGTIEHGIDPWHLPDDALDADHLEQTLANDALDVVARATHWLVYDTFGYWPRCEQHPDRHVLPRDGVWRCPGPRAEDTGDEHDLAPIGQLSPPPRRKRLRSDGNVEYLDE